MHKKIATIVSFLILTSTASAYYNPQLGRFLQRDPKGYIDGMNQYEYVRSMPTVRVDPMGRESKATPLTSDRKCCYGKTYDIKTQCCYRGKNIQKRGVWDILAKNGLGRKIDGSCCFKSDCSVGILRGIKGAFTAHSVAFARVKSTENYKFPNNYIVIGAKNRLWDSNKLEDWRFEKRVLPHPQYAVYKALSFVPCSITNKWGAFASDFLKKSNYHLNIDMPWFEKDCRWFAKFIYTHLVREALKLDPPPCNEAVLRHHLQKAMRLPNWGGTSVGERTVGGLLTVDRNEK